jgi:hypothetical protein
MAISKRPSLRIGLRNQKVVDGFVHHFLFPHYETVAYGYVVAVGLGVLVGCLIVIETVNVEPKA